MSILSSELTFYKAAGTSDTVPASNGGLMSGADLITSGVLQNVFPHALAAERASGSIKYRKLFPKVDNAEELSLIDPKIWLDIITAGDDWAVMFAGTQSDTEADIGTPRLYGCATLKTTVSVGGSTLVVTVEDTSITGIFVSGDVIRITDMVAPDSGTGEEQFMTINGAPSVSGDEVTITTTETLQYAFTAGEATRVMSALEPGDIECSVDNWVETSAGTGTYDESLYPVITYNIGTIEQEWTIEFTDTTNFTVTGDTVGSLTSGTVGSDYAYENPNFAGIDYFMLETAGWDDMDWANGDTIVFQTHPAAVPIWEKRVIPAGAVSLANNKIVLVVSGESA